MRGLSRQTPNRGRGWWRSSPAGTGVRPVVGPSGDGLCPGESRCSANIPDYAGGRSLLGAVPRGFAVAASPRSDGMVCVRDARRQQQVVIDSAGPIPSTTGWLTYAAVAMRRLTLNFPGAAWGVDVTIASDLPPAAGLSSSSALVIAVATAIIRRARLESRPEWLGAIRTLEDLSGYFGAMERGADFGPLAGTIAVGTFGGSEDHTAILTCRPGLLSGYCSVPFVLARRAMPPGWTFVIASSGIEADKAGRARQIQPCSWRPERCRSLAEAIRSPPATLAGLLASTRCRRDSLVARRRSGSPGFRSRGTPPPVAALHRRRRQGAGRDAGVQPWRPRGSQCVVSDIAG